MAKSTVGSVALSLVSGNGGSLASVASANAFDAADYKKERGVIWQSVITFFGGDIKVAEEMKNNVEQIIPNVIERFRNKTNLTEDLKIIMFDGHHIVSRFDVDMANGVPYSRDLLALINAVKGYDDVKGLYPTWRYMAPSRMLKVIHDYTLREETSIIDNRKAFWDVNDTLEQALVADRFRDMFNLIESGAPVTMDMVERTRDVVSSMLVLHRVVVAHEAVNLVYQASAMRNRKQRKLATFIEERKGFINMRDLEKDAERARAGKSPGMFRKADMLMDNAEQVSRSIRQATETLDQLNKMAMNIIGMKQDVPSSNFDVLTFDSEIVKPLPQAEVEANAKRAKDLEMGIISAEDAKKDSEAALAAKKIEEDADKQIKDLFGMFKFADGKQRKEAEEKLRTFIAAQSGLAEKKKETVVVVEKKDPLDDVNDRIKTSKRVL